MSQKKNYSRYFIILQEDEKGYGVAADKLPTGYAKLEVKNGKCKISFYVQNLKKEMKPYHMILIFNKNSSDKKLIKLGELNIDDTGRAEVSKEYEAGNIANTSMQIDKICGAAVARFVDANMTCVMKGFTNTGSISDWKEYELVDAAKDESKTKFDEYEEKIEKSKEEVKHIKKDEIEKINEQRVVKEKAEKKIQQDIKDEVKSSVKANKEKEQREIKKVENTENINKEEIKEDIKEDIEEEKLAVNEEIIKPEKEYTDENKNLSRNSSEEHNKKNKSDRFFEGITEDLEEWEDDFEELPDCRWFKVGVGNVEDMYRAKSYNKHAVIYYPMTNYYPYIIRHGHYLFGYKHDKAKKVKYLIYAIPGTKAHYDQPFGGRFGFVSWTQPKLDKGKYGNMGYWLMFYDFRKSVVVIPSKR